MLDVLLYYDSSVSDKSQGDVLGTMSMLQGIAALNVYKQVALVRKSTDTLTFEDEEGKLQTIRDLGEAASSSVSFGIPRPTTHSLYLSSFCFLYTEWHVSVRLYILTVYVLSLESIATAQAQARDSDPSYRRSGRL
jgi:hypothetical protein